MHFKHSNDINFNYSDNYIPLKDERDRRFNSSLILNKVVTKICMVDPGALKGTQT
jgi:hypothetical protein